MRSVMAVVLAVLLVGCVHAERFYGPTGEAGFVITCNGNANSMARCYERASEECGGRYRIVSGQNDQRIVHNLYNGDPMVRDHREITVICDQSQRRNVENSNVEL